MNGLASAQSRSGRARKPRVRFFSATVLALGCLGLLTGTACHRSQYRQKADAEAYQLVREKANHPHWALPNYTIDIDPRSRMYSPDNPDKPPMPPDDPTSHRLMKRVDNKPGYPGWEAGGRTPFVENPEWLSFVPLDEDGVLSVNSVNAVKLARLHSPDYQQELEELYLSALDVSFERFAFDAQFFAGYSAFYTADGPNRSGLGGDSSSELDAGSFSNEGDKAALRKMGITGSELVIGFANRLVWQFSGPDSQTATTLLDFSLIQPLLRNAGRDRIMETLTLSERDLLSNVRQMERYQRGFYIQIITGGDAGPGPSRRGGVFGGGLTGFTGVGGGGFGQLGGGGGNQAFGQTGAGQAGGFIGLLQLQQDLRNQELNIIQLRRSAEQFEAFFDANRISALQVQQANQALRNAQSAYLNSKTGYQNDLDRFKASLGLPPQLNIKIDDPMLDEFNLLDPHIAQRQDELAEVQNAIGNTINPILRAVEQANEQVAWNEQLARDLDKLRGYVIQAGRIRQQLEENVQLAKLDIDRLRKAVPNRKRELDRLSQRVKDAAKTGGSPGMDLKLLDSSGLEQRPDQLDGSLEALRTVEKLRAHLDALPEYTIKSLTDFRSLVNQGQLNDKDLPEGLTQEQVRELLEVVGSLVELDSRFRSYDARFGAIVKEIDQLLADGHNIPHDKLLARIKEQVFIPLPDALINLSEDVFELLLLQVQARTDAISLVSIELDSDEAFEVARDYRRDLMNQRAALVDAWRLIEFNADNLESSLDIVFEGDISNDGDSPFPLKGSTGRLRAGIQFDAPIVRLDERNTYRQSLIEYQQARRSYYQFRDQIAQDLRATLRSVELNQFNFELRREAIRVAVRQVEQVREREPPRPGQEDTMLGPTTARDLVSALADLLNGQNDFVSVWVNYEVLRRSLDFNLGLMQIDYDGIWIDPGPVGKDYGFPAGVNYKSCTADTLVLPQSDGQQSIVENERTNQGEQ